METKTNEIKEVLFRLAKLQADIDYVKSHIKDEDIFLTEEEEQLLEKSYGNEKDGKLISSKKMREELRI